MDISLFVAIGSLIFSLIVYFAHDRKLNAQQKLLNELALQKAAQEETDSKKASIFLSHERIGTSDKLVGTNKGQATAYDIKLSSQIDNDPVMMLDIPPQWTSLKPGQEVKRPLPLGRGVAMQVTYDITWRDELGEHKDSRWWTTCDEESGRSMLVRPHTHDVTLRALAGASAQGPLLFHQVLQRHVFPPIRRPQEPEQPELWQPFCEGYEVSNHGRVRSRRQVLVNLLDSREEPIQVIRGKWYRVKRLVAEHFLPNPDGKRRLRHINGDTHDCHATNLEWW